MELNWTTFILEIVNFLILVWILKRFFYRPVLAAVARRRADIEKSMTDAESLRDEAEALRVQYDDRLQAWEKERDSARTTLYQEIEAERGRLRGELQTALAEEKEKAKVREQRRLESALRHYEETALAQGGRFTAALLGRVADARLEERLIDLVLEDLTTQPPEWRRAVRAGAHNGAADVTVTTAYPLDNERRRRLEEALAALLGEAVEPRYEQNAALLAGLRVTVGPWVLQANLQDELRYFAEQAHGRHDN